VIVPTNYTAGVIGRKTEMKWTGPRMGNRIFNPRTGQSDPTGDDDKEAVEKAGDNDRCIELNGFDHFDGGRSRCVGAIQDFKN
jgi:hypothetical protein